VSGVQIEVTGLKEFRSALRAVDSTLGPELRRGLNEVGDVIVADARPDIPLGPGTDGQHLRDSIRSQSTQTEGRVIVGRGKTAGRAGYVIFGGGPTSHRGNNRRPFIAEGRALFPSVKRRNTEIIGKLTDVLARLKAKIDG
jgi:hypothetical protein